MFFFIQVWLSDFFVTSQKLNVSFSPYLLVQITNISPVEEEKADNMCCTLHFKDKELVALYYFFLKKKIWTNDLP